MSFELRQLRHFESLYRFRNFRLAAEEQGLTHSALTKSIRKLEQDLGVRLFDRTTRIVEPTAAGEHLMEKVRVLLEQAANLSREASLLTGAHVGELRIGGGQVVLDTIVPRALERFVKHHDEVVVDICAGESEELVEMLVAGGLDMVMFDLGTFKPEKYKNELSVLELKAEPMVLVHRRGHPDGGDALVNGAYAKYPWAVPGHGPAIETCWPKAVVEHLSATRAGGATYRFSSMQSCLRVVERTDLITVVPLSVAQEEVDSERLEMVKLPLEWKFAVGVYTVKRRTLSPVAKALIEDLQMVA